jgi:hypothetical protein
MQVGEMCYYLCTQITIVLCKTKACLREVIRKEAERQKVKSEKQKAKTEKGEGRREKGEGRREGKKNGEGRWEKREERREKGQYLHQLECTQCYHILV